MARYTEQIQDWLFATEGGYVNHPRDPGGATNYGVTKRVYEGFLGHKVTNNDVKNMPKGDAASIMKKQYWDRIMGDSLPKGLDYALFDYAVNSGPNRAVKDLQRCLKFTGSDVDGIIGFVTLSAITEFNNIKGLIICLCERRYSFVKRLRTFNTFGSGWTRRIMGNKLGYQSADIGVIDRAVKLYHNSETIPAPTQAAPHRAHPEVSNPWSKPEVLAPVGGVVTAVGGVAANNPYMQIVLSVGMLGLFAVGIYFAVTRIKNSDPN